LPESLESLNHSERGRRKKGYLRKPEQGQSFKAIFKANRTKPSLQLGSLEIKLKIS